MKNQWTDKVEAQAAEIASLEAERRRDAIDGQCALDEANTEIAALKEEVERLKAETWYSSYYQVLARAEAAEGKVEKAVAVVDRNEKWLGENLQESKGIVMARALNDLGVIKQLLTGGTHE